MKIVMSKIKKTTGSIKPIKPFTTIEEEANFWDTHSVVDEVNKGTLVGFHQAKKEQTLTIRFDKQTLQVLREKAFKMGVGPTTLARIWLTEKLQSVKTN